MVDAVPSWADLDRVDSAAVADVVAALSPAARDRLGAQLVALGAITLVSVVAEPSPFLNRAWGIGGEGPATTNEVEAVAAHYRGLGVESFGVLVNDLAEPADSLPGWLARAGFRRGPGSPKLWRGPEPAGSTDRPATSAVEVVVTTDAELVADLSVRGFGWGQHLRDWCAAPVGRPGWTHHVARTRAEAVGVAALRIVDGVAWLGGGAVVPEARGRGAHAALIGARITAAAGCTAIVSETGDAPNASLRNLIRLGFAVGGHRTNWVAGR